MRVLIDGGISSSGGYVRFLRGILSAGAIPNDVEVSLLCSPNLAEKMGTTLDRNVDVIAEPELAITTSRLRRRRWWSKGYPDLVTRLDPDVIFHPLGFLRKAPGGTRSVVAFLNMLPFDVREIKRYGISRRALMFLQWRLKALAALRGADGVIFQSEYVRKEANRQVKGTSMQAVIPAANDAHFRLDEAPTPRSLGSPIEVLYVSTIFLYKHQWNVVEAVGSLREDLGLDIRLRLFGSGEPVAKKKLDQRIRELGAGPYTKVTGDVPLDEDEMAALYRGTDLFVFASSCESFPTILLEAMGAGLPIACSDRCAMPDILQDGGAFFDPESPASIAAALRKLVQDPELRSRCATKAHEYERRYSWGKTAGEVFGFLRNVADR